MATPPRADDEPLPVTFRFVMALGIFIVAGWAAMFLLLASRW
jgi:hypothetical protein